MFVVIAYAKVRSERSCFVHLGGGKGPETCLAGMNCLLESNYEFVNSLIENVWTPLVASFSDLVLTLHRAEWAGNGRRVLDRYAASFVGGEDGPRGSRERGEPS